MRARWSRRLNVGGVVGVVTELDAVYVGTANLGRIRLVEELLA
jgi:hypothetical protein